MLSTSYVVFYAIVVMYGLLCAFLGYAAIHIVAVGVFVFGYLALATFGNLDFIATMMLLLFVVLGLAMVHRYVDVRHTSILLILGKAVLNMATIVLVGTCILACVVNRFVAYVFFAMYIGVDIYVGITYSERIRTIVVTCCLGASIVVGALAALWLDDQPTVSETPLLKLLLGICIALVGGFVQVKTTAEPPPSAALRMSRISLANTHVSEIPTPTAASSQWVSAPG
ncbi:hypothetical protein SDRG_15533 [Saprolegnia diclina VS20]|uniref:DUF4203 domain-containing protein n=1 Tax=Saprolegnia diclina (strain VS20) TaxID=1156394 RepID=T0R3G2_SAPDV|nr:hypothetical protein SDRG_15533 [Saprolegnia diclina VS20]EQC26593.1 hypothetical protein SDRG_15533 [Saprolegnia diclina VS20]|eukprot:XP_008619931.1 hypothetical protein SDRG_15533 [Saprolegnia diclina VS20]